MLQGLGKLLFGGARRTRDANAVVQAVKQRSLLPILKRVWNKWVGRNIVNKLWWK